MPSLTFLLVTSGPKKRCEYFPQDCNCSTLMQLFLPAVSSTVLGNWNIKMPHALPSFSDLIICAPGDEGTGEVTAVCSSL